jgi:excisionase family DNA binding protein
MSAQGGISVAEAAERLGISKEAVRRRIDRKSLHATKAVDGTWRVHLADEPLPRTPTTGRMTDDTQPSMIPIAALLAEKDARIALLTNQMSVKDQQIADLTRQSERLQSLLGNEQETTQRLLAAPNAPETPVQPAEHESGLSDAPTQLRSVQRVPRPSWWQRLIEWLRGL